MWFGTAQRRIRKGLGWQIWPSFSSEARREGKSQEDGWIDRDRSINKQGDR